MQTDVEDQIRVRAYGLWQADGSPAGREQFYWFRAVADITQAAFAEAPVKKLVRKRKPAAVRAA